MCEVIFTRKKIEVEEIKKEFKIFREDINKFLGLFRLRFLIAVQLLLMIVLIVILFIEALNNVVYVVMFVFVLVYMFLDLEKKARMLRDGLGL